MAVGIIEPAAMAGQLTRLRTASRSPALRLEASIIGFLARIVVRSSDGAWTVHARIDAASPGSHRSGQRAKCFARLWGQGHEVASLPGPIGGLTSPRAPRSTIRFSI